MVLTSNPYDRYRQQGVLTASPMELVVMLYDGCVRQLRVAILAMNEGNVPFANEAMLKAQAIVQELSMSLDRQYPISAEIGSIYDFVEETIFQAIQTGDVKDIPGIVEIMGDLRATWLDVSRRTRASSLAIED